MLRVFTVKPIQRAWTVVEREMIYTEKDPGATEDFLLDWSAAVAGDQITSSNWTVTSGLTLVSSSNAPGSATARISGGTVGQIYTASNTVTLASGQIKVANIRITAELA